MPKRKARLAKRKLERVGMLVSGACMIVVGLVVVVLIGMVVKEGTATFVQDGVGLGEFLFGSSWAPEKGIFGVLPPLVGSFGVTLLSGVLAVPIAVASAIFVVEIAPAFGRRFFQPTLEVLVGVPSVVYGVVGLYVVNAALRALFGPAAGTGAGILSGALVLAVMILPTVTTLSVDALRAVPQAYREGAYALGATRYQTIRSVVLKCALPSLATAVIMGMTRAFGETLAVQMVIGGVARSLPTGILDPAATLTTALTAGLSNAVVGSAFYHALWTLALVLLGMSLVFILLIHVIQDKGVRAHG